MTDSREARQEADPAAAFRAEIEELHRDGVYSYALGRKIPWAEARELDKMGGIVRAALSVSLHGEAVPGADTLAAIERNIDYGALPALQRDLLLDVRVNLDAGALPGPHMGPGLDPAWSALKWIDGIDGFDRGLERYKADGLYHRPENTPWAEVPEAGKVRAIVGLAQHDGPTGAYALAAIEREVDYSRLPLWRREALEGLRTRLDAGELKGRQPRDNRDRAHYALRLVEFEARIEEYRSDGDPWQGQTPVPWATLPEVRKLDLIVQEAGWQHLYFEPREHEIIDREVDLSRVPGGRRHGIENNRERLRIGPEEYERRRQEKYAPPNDAAAAFKERIEEGLWKTCFTDGATIFADWSDLTPEAKLRELAGAMDWEQVPESYFRIMAARELKLEELPPDVRAALESPKANRQFFAEGFEDGINGAEPGHDENRALGVEPGGDSSGSDEQREVKIRELFDTANRVMLAELIQKKALSPEIALRPSEVIRAAYFEQAEKTWNSFREEVELRPDAEIKETLEAFIAKEHALGTDRPKTLIDHLQAGGLFMRVGVPGKGSQVDAAPVREPTRSPGKDIAFPTDRDDLPPEPESREVSPADLVERAVTPSPTNGYTTKHKL